MNEERRSIPSSAEVKARKRKDELSRTKATEPSRRVPDGRVPVIENTDPNAAENQPERGHEVPQPIPR
jgi:hypothetical protein